MNTDSFNQRELRDALSNFATGVTIVTSCNDAGEPVGMTASSFNSVSMQPPLILWSVTKSALSAPVFKNAEHFCVHILAADQIALSNRFAKSGEDKFAGLQYSKNAHGIPQLSGAATRFDCRTWSVYEGGDHWIIVGEINAVMRRNAEALVFSGGSYATATLVPPPTPSGVANNHRDAASEPDNNPNHGNSDGAANPIDKLLIYNLAHAYRAMSSRFHAVVRQSGLTVPEWRILASLHNCTTRSLTELSSRTFIEQNALADMLAPMQQKGLCRCDAELEALPGDTQITGTTRGHARVEHLFALAEKLEQTAIGEKPTDDLAKLNQLLRRVVEADSL